MAAKMATYQMGETVICSAIVTNDARTLCDPETSMKITIKDSGNGVEVDDVVMVKDNTGTYHYDYTIDGARGVYGIIYTAIDGTRITKQLDSFIAG